MPFPSPRDLPDPEIEPGSSTLQADALTSKHQFFGTQLSWHSGFPGGSIGKESTCNVGDLGSIPGLGRSPGEGKGNPLQYSGLENSMDYMVHGVAKSQTQVSDFHFPDIKLTKLCHCYVKLLA